MSGIDRASKGLVWGQIDLSNAIFNPDIAHMADALAERQITTDEWMGGMRARITYRKSAHISQLARQAAEVKRAGSWGDGKGRFHINANVVRCEGNRGHHYLHGLGCRYAVQRRNDVDSECAIVDPHNGAVGQARLHDAIPAEGLGLQRT